MLRQHFFRRGDQHPVNFRRNFLQVVVAGAPKALDPRDHSPGKRITLESKQDGQAARRYSRDNRRNLGRTNAAAAHDGGKLGASPGGVLNYIADIPARKDLSLSWIGHRNSLPDY